MFINRSKELALIENFVFNSKRQFLYIYGKRGIGKTSLIYQFVQMHKKQLNDNVLFLNAYSFDGLPNNFLNSTKDLLIIDDYYEFSGENAVSIALPTSSLKKIFDYSTAKKVILLSPEPPPYILNSHNDIFIKGRVEVLELKPFSNQELDTLFKFAYNTDKKLNLTEFYNYFENNPRSILTALNYFSHSNFNDGTDFLDFINKPIKQSGIIDIYGNPLSPDTEATKIITQTVKVINHSLIEKVNENPNLIFQLTSRNFEELVAELLEKEGFNVNLTKQTRDGGKDILVAQKNNLGNFLYYVECKHHTLDNPVRVNLVRELYGTVSADRATAGLLVTSSYFTKNAIAFTQNLQHQLSLKGYIDLKKWISEICKKN